MIQIIFLVVFIGIVYLAYWAWKRHSGLIESIDKSDGEKLREKEVELDAETVMRKQDNDILWDEINEVEPRRNK